jgi:hypothetical protein
MWTRAGLGISRSTCWEYMRILEKLISWPCFLLRLSKTHCTWCTAFSLPPQTLRYPTRFIWSWLFQIYFSKFTFPNLRQSALMTPSVSLLAIAACSFTASQHDNHRNLWPVFSWISWNRCPKPWCPSSLSKIWAPPAMISLGLSSIRQHTYLRNWCGFPSFHIVYTV